MVSARPSVTEPLFRIPLCDPARQARALETEILAAVQRIIAGGKYILGPEVVAFEREVAERLGVPHAIGCASGTDALWLSLKAIGAGRGDRVLTTPFTFFATASAVLNAGAEPVFADLDPVSLHLSPVEVRKALEGRNPVWQRLGIAPDTVKAIVPVHLYGHTASMEELQKSAVSFGIPIIEDAAQAFGAKLSTGAFAGAAGELGCYSFFPTKNLGGCGDGGMVVTASDSLAEKVRLLRAHGASPRYVHHMAGTNSRLDALQAGILRVKLPALDGFLAARRRHAKKYCDALGDLRELVLPGWDGAETHAFHQFTVRVLGNRRGELMRFLSERGIETIAYYPVPLHLQPALRSLCYREGDYPEAERAAGEVLSLPMFPELTEEEREIVAATIREFFRG
jgi:dTDP-4-amino-4,6-dideoxygalactose transaminase